uniref:Uncharacterized protein LOC111123112 isoform X2 n=1 Tax=Crassostrea virginica TaxID=6565 RepID=A0A8B8CYH0_CRAVI|nr:uncharacterized protein LOC111123112 isoform X2 [Crassostrea virginica]
MSREQKIPNYDGPQRFLPGLNHASDTYFQSQDGKEKKRKNPRNPKIQNNDGPLSSFPESNHPSYNNFQIKEGRLAPLDNKEMTLPDEYSNDPRKNPGKQTQQVHSKKPKSKTIRTGIFLTFEILAMIAAFVLVFFCDEISKVNSCELERALDSIHLDYTPHPCQYHEIKEKLKIPFGFGVGYLVIKGVIFASFAGFKYGWLEKGGQEKKDRWKSPFHIIIAGVSFSFFLTFLLISILVVHENKEQTNVNFDALGSSMLSWLQNRFTSDDLNSGDTISTAWNDFFIQYDCCAVYQVTGTTNDFDRTPWCTTSGSCQATSSQIPKTCCKSVTKDNYQNASSGCHASVNPGTYKQSCLSRMKTLSIVNINESQVNVLFYFLLILMLSQFWQFCLALWDRYHHKKHIIRLGIKSNNHEEHD